jgi:hypothetical protein
VTCDIQWTSRAVDTRTGAQRRVDGRPTEVDMCPTKGAWVPDGEREWPNEAHDGFPTEGSGGGPTEEYIYWW